MHLATNIVNGVAETGRLMGKLAEIHDLNIFLKGRDIDESFKTIARLGCIVKYFNPHI